MVRADGTGLVFAIKDAGRFTARLRRLPVGATAPADGPYGAFTREAQLDDRPAVLVAGGSASPRSCTWPCATRTPPSSAPPATATRPLYARDLVRRVLPLRRPRVHDVDGPGPAGARRSGGTGCSASASSGDLREGPM
ncbi:hypothetical protein [Nonomuraea sp. KM90]|uniref:hypothetical protein n=1 Tax=Nonomuraea sp. KM90 TaxID=3457428 RepID=UPI003FCE9E91